MLFTLLGYFFGRLEFVQKHFELVIVAIILMSVVPMIVEWWKARRESKMEKANAETP
jgi:membrane-associated protein